jgi:hypothetical protein
MVTKQKQQWNAYFQHENLAFTKPQPWFVMIKVVKNE